MKLALRIAAVLFALLFGAIFAGFTLFADETFYGLRPHAVKADLDQHSVADLLALAENGPTKAVLLYDAWYKGRDGQTGWFILSAEQTGAITFGVNGALDPSLSKLFGSSPRRCQGSGLPEKMIRVIEPDRKKSGFLGRSSCKRTRMDLKQVIAQSEPAVRHEEWMDWETLMAFDSASAPQNLRDPVDFWPTPYAYSRDIYLPLVWETQTSNADSNLRALRQNAQALADDLSRDGKVDVQLVVKSWVPRPVPDVEVPVLPFRSGGGIVFLTQMEVARIGFTVRCGAQARAACDAMDVSALLPEIGKLRDTAVWSAAVDAALPNPTSGEVAWRDVLRLADLSRRAVFGPASEPRSFWVTWYEALSP